MKVLYSMLLILVLTACTNSKCVVDDTVALNFGDLAIGKSHTAVIGRIKSIQQAKDNVKISLFVEKMKQGGATAPALSINSQAEIVFTPIFQRNYQNLKNATVLSALHEDNRILVLVNRNSRDKQIEVVQLKIEK